MAKSSSYNPFLPLIPLIALFTSLSLMNAMRSHRDNVDVVTTVSTPTTPDLDKKREAALEDASDFLRKKADKLGSDTHKEVDGTTFPALLDEVKQKFSTADVSITAGIRSGWDGKDSWIISNLVATDKMGGQSKQTFGEATVIEINGNATLTDIRRETSAQEALWYGRALADSLMSVRAKGSTIVDADNFGKLAKRMQDKFSDASIKVEAAMSQDIYQGTGTVITEIKATDSKGQTSQLMAGDQINHPKL